MTFDQSERDYRSDPMFRQVVDTIECWIRDANVTPAEARAAAMLACLHFENSRTQPSMFMRHDDITGADR